MRGTFPSLFYPYLPIPPGEDKYRNGFMKPPSIESLWEIKKEFDFCLKLWYYILSDFFKRFAAVNV